MDEMFSGYGEFPSNIGEFCTAEDISLDHIERLACQRLENFQEADVVYLSHDLYMALHKTLLSTMRFTSGQGFAANSSLATLKINTVAGELMVKHVSHLTNFCYVGTHTGFEHLEWIKIGAEFEKIVLGGDE